MIILMFISWLFIWVIVGNSEREPNWRLATIQSGIVWGVFLILGTEILSYFRSINRLGLGIMWTLPILSGVIWGWIRLKSGKVLRLPVVYHRDSSVGLVLDLCLILILVITALVAITAPPNSNDALVFRMSRVAHWAQNQTLAHYPTGIEIQNSYSPGAEMMLLNVYVLDGWDRYVNLIAWFCFAGTVAAAASLAEVLGASQNGQRMAAIFSATLPVAITQATSALNDVVVSFWIVATVLMLLNYTRKAQKPFTLILMGLSAALAVVTKSSSLIFLWPFALYLVIILRRRLGLPKMILWAVIGILLMALINGGHFSRNQRTYGQFYRPRELTVQTNELRNWRVLVSNITRNAALHADLPFPRADDWLKDNLRKLHEIIELDQADPRTTLGETFYIPEVNTSEMTSGNPLHAAIIVFSFTVIVGLVLLGKEDPEILVYSAAVFISLLMFVYLLKWQVTGSRLHLPFFVMFAPMTAVLLDRLGRYRLETAIAILLLVYAVPWLFQTEERPILPDPNRTYPISVFGGERLAMYFATNPDDFLIYQQIAEKINTQGVSKIGLNLTSTSEEYPFWVLLGAPEEDVNIQWIKTETTSQRYLDPKFVPQAVICENCSQDEISAYAENYMHFSYPKFDLFLEVVN